MYYLYKSCDLLNRLVIKNKRVQFFELSSWRNFPPKQFRRNPSKTIL